MEERLHLQDCKCPICMCILIEPVRMPCSHELCMPCFKQNVEEAHFTCPICRLRISSWARKQSRLGQLVDERRWQQIQEAFPLLCQKRLNGDDEDSEYEDESPVKRKVLVAQPGEIRKEYEEEISKFQKIRQQEERKAIEESELLIKRLQREEILRYEEKKAALEVQAQTDEELAKVLSAKLEEEEKWKREQREQTTRDEELARRLQESEKSPNAVISLSSPSTSSQKGPTPSMKCARLEHLFSRMEDRKLHREEINQGQGTSPSRAFGAFSPTATTRLPSMEGVGGVSVQRTKSRESEDSITTEVCHFKPIKTSPRTARRRLADGSRDSPPIVLSTPRNLSNVKNCRSQDMAPTMKSRLVEMLSKKLPHSPTEPDSKLTLRSKEVQASPTEHSKTTEREANDEVPSVADGNEEPEPAVERKDDVSDQRMVDIQSKLSKYSRKRKEESNEQSKVVSKHSDRDKNSSNGNTKRKTAISREGAESKSKRIRLKRSPPKSPTEEKPIPACKKFKGEVYPKDKNDNDVSMNSRNVEVVKEEGDASRRHNGRGDEESSACGPANGIQSSQPKNSTRSSDGSRRCSGQNSIVKYMELLTAEQTKLQQEEIDHRIALDLQRQFEEEEESNAPLSPVVRTKGSEDAYPLRTGRKRTYREISPSPES